MQIGLEKSKICKNNDHTCLFHCIYTCRHASYPTITKTINKSRVIFMKNLMQLSQPGSYILNVIIFFNQAPSLCSFLTTVNDLQFHNIPKSFISTLIQSVKKIDEIIGQDRVPKLILNIKGNSSANLKKMTYL